MKPRFEIAFQDEEARRYEIIAFRVDLETKKKLKAHVKDSTVSDFLRQLIERELDEQKRKV